MDAFFAYTAACHLAFKPLIKYALLIVSKRYRMTGQCAIYCGQTLKIRRVGVSALEVQGELLFLFLTEANYTLE